MQEAEAKKILTDQGFKKIYTWFDSPDETYAPHAHPTERNHIVLEGLMTVTMNDETTSCGPGDAVLIPARTVHSALIGPEGCAYVVGER